ncbi:MAG TPA: arylesterase [Chthoniobacteraceae bacterium]
MTSLRTLTLGLLMWTNHALWGADAASANPAPAKAPRIVVLGDSITAGYGIDPSAAYPNLLQAKIKQAGLNYEVVNAGLSGDTTSGGLRRIDWALGQGAEVLIVALGGNDGLRGLPPKQTAGNLEQIVLRARARLPQLTVIIAGMQMPLSMGRDFAEQFAALFPRVAKETRADLVPYLLEGVGGVAKLNQPDLIHPTPEGQQRIAENVWAVLKPVLEKRKATP